MRHIILIITGMLFFEAGISQVLKKDILNNIPVPIQKESLIPVGKTYSKNIRARIAPFAKKSTISGLTISGSGSFKNDAGMIRVILIDEQDNEYLIYEANRMFNEANNFIFNEKGFETTILDTIVPKSIELFVENATLNIAGIQTYQIDEGRKQKGTDYKKIMKSNRQEQKLTAVKDYIKKHNMVWSAGHTPLSSLPYSEKKKIFGEGFNTYGMEYYIVSNYSKKNIVQ